MRFPTLVIPVALAAAVASCDSPVTGPEAAFDRFALAPQMPPAGQFVQPITEANANPWFPLVPGTIWVYEAETEDGIERTVDMVTGDTRLIDAGTGPITATVVRDEVYLAGALVELTFDWYAQDVDGNVWYLGESACEFEPGSYPGGDACEPAGDPGGSWEAGRDGAEAGIIMWADPGAYRGITYRQEFYEGEAEDMAKVLRTGLTVAVEAGTYTDCIETMDWTPLEPGAREQKFYCAGIGLVLEVQPKGGRVRNELVSVDME